MNRYLNISLFALGAHLIFPGAALAADEAVTRAQVMASNAPNRLQPWMDADVATAWSRGYTGQNTRITVVDDFSSQSRFAGNLDGQIRVSRHGEWTTREASLIAPSASIANVDFRSRAPSLPLMAKGLNVINASYGVMAFASSLHSPSAFMSGVHGAVVNSARIGSAVVVKAAGNSRVAVDGVAEGKLDYLNLALRGAQSAIFVGALSPGKVDASGKPQNQLAGYSNFSGNDKRIQKQFLAVVVDTAKTGMAGTSFAAPIVSGYAAILGSKFTAASPTQIANQLLATARTDTIADYNPAQHGRGEASLARALAPVSIR